MNHYPHHIGDRLKDSSHFSLLQHGIHIRLIEVYYTREKPYKDAQEACYLIGARTKQEKQAVMEVLQQTFKETADGWMQSRCETELQRFKEKAAKASQSAAARWGKSSSERNANASPPDDANAMRTHCEGNANQNQNQNHIARNGAMRPRKRPATAVPAEFDVTDEMAQWAVGQGVVAERVLPETEKFLDHFRATGKPQSDWLATWRNWMRRSVEMRR